MGESMKVKSCIRDHSVCAVIGYTRGHHLEQKNEYQGKIHQQVEGEITNESLHIWYLWKAHEVSFHFDTFSKTVLSNTLLLCKQCVLAFTFSTRSHLMKLSRGNLLWLIYGALSLHNPACLQVHCSLQHLGRITKRRCSKESSQ